MQFYQFPSDNWRKIAISLIDPSDGGLGR